MKNIFRVDTKKLTERWDKGLLKDCYCLIFSDSYGFRIVWNDEKGFSHRLNKDKNTILLNGFFIVLAVYETEEQAKKHFSDFIKWAD